MVVIYKKKSRLHIHVYDVSLEGLQDGVNQIFKFTEVKPDPLESVQVYKNGLLLKQGEDADYLLDSYKVTFSVENIPQVLDNLIFNYTIRK